MEKSTNKIIFNQVLYRYFYPGISTTFIIICTTNCYNSSRFSQDLVSDCSLPIRPHRKSCADRGKQVMWLPCDPPQSIVSSSSNGSGRSRICRTIPTNSSSILWFNIADTSMYLQRCFVAKFKPSVRRAKSIYCGLGSMVTFSGRGGIKTIIHNILAGRK